VAPKPVLDTSAASVAQLLERYDRAVKAAEQQSPSFRDAGEVRGPGIQKRTQTMPLESGSAPSARPGMTTMVSAAR
jgi:hypothetical protein